MHHRKREHPSIIAHKYFLTYTCTTAQGADENDDDPDDEHKYVNTETDNNIESKKSVKQKNLKTEYKSIVFNYSKIVLKVNMINVLNRGLIFCILLKKIDITQILIDWKRFEQSMIWKEFCYGKETRDLKKKIKTMKNKLPRLSF